MSYQKSSFSSVRVMEANHRNLQFHEFLGAFSILLKQAGTVIN